MDKLKMAHDWAMNTINAGYCNETKLMVKEAWEYADLMQAEADEREQQKQDKLKQDQQNHHYELASIGLEEWQPDWSQAPLWAKYWSIDADGECYWFENKPELMSVTWLPFDASEVNVAPPFNYNGNWQDSLRKRPSNI